MWKTLTKRGKREKGDGEAGKRGLQERERRRYIKQDEKNKWENGRKDKGNDEDQSNETSRRR